MLGVRENGTNIFIILFSVMSVKRPPYLLNIGCINPIHIGNRYFPCGRCNACLLAKSNKNRYNLTLELSNPTTKCCFIMLTYDKEHLPLVKVTKSAFDAMFYKNPINKPEYEKRNFFAQLSYDKQLSKITNLSARKEFVRAYTVQSRTPLSTLQQLGYNNSTQSDCYYMLPTLTYAHVSSFLKRLRIKVLRQVGEQNIRFAACGEYGPTGHRPHYHVIVICQSEAARQSVMRNYRSCWIHGFSNAKLYTKSKNSADYVANYVTCSPLLPKLYTYKPFKPFFRGSNYLGCKEYATHTNFIKICEAQAFSQILPFRSKDNTEYTAVPFSLQSAIFPKCRDYGELCSSRRLERYTFFLRQDIQDVRKFKKQLINEYISYISRFGGNFTSSLTDGSYPVLARYVSVFGLLFDKHTDSNTIINRINYDCRICTLFASSSHTIFGEYCPRQMLDLIESYYSHKDYYNLSRCLERLEKFEIFPQDFVRTYYNLDTSTNAYRRLEDVSPVQDDYLREYANYCASDMKDRIKTKKINDYGKRTHSS